MTAKPDDLAPDEQDLPLEVLAQFDAIRERHRSDPPLEQLRAAHAGVLPDGAQQMVSAHLAADPWSQALLEAGSEAGGVDDVTKARLLARIKRELKDLPAPSTPWWRTLTGPAAAAVLVAAIWFTPASRPPAAPAPAIETISPAAATEPIATPASRLPFTQPALRLGLRALAWRGAPGDNQYVAALKPAFDAYRDGDYVRARAAFDRLAERYPDGLEVQFYGGITRMALGDNDGARESFRAAARIDDATFNDEVRRWLVVAEQRADRPQTAPPR